MSSMSSTATNLVLIKDMRPAQRGIECEAIVIQKDPDPTITRDGDNLHRMLVADKSGSIFLTVWNHNGELLRSGDIVYISGGECRFRKGQLQLSVLRNSKLKRIGQDTFVFVEKPNFSEQTQVQQPPAVNPHMSPQEQQQRIPQRHQQARPSPQPQHRGGFRGGRSRDPRQRGRSTPQPQ